MHFLTSSNVQPLLGYYRNPALAYADINAICGEEKICAEIYQLKLIVRPNNEIHVFVTFSIQNNFDPPPENY